MLTVDGHSEAGCARIAQLKRRIEIATKQIQQIAEKQAKELDARDSDQPQHGRVMSQAELEEEINQSLEKADANKRKILEIREDFDKVVAKQKQKRGEQEDK